MNAIATIPELAALDGGGGLIRIPVECDVPVTPRVRALIDTAEFRRLSRISQLGLVALVYPAANHTRFEHSLGVFRTALLYLKRLRHDERFTQAITSADAEVFLAAALLHDLGHWPYCHAIEDLALPGVPEHELFANSFLLEGDIADVLREDWGVRPRDVVSLLSEKPRDRRGRLLASMLSGPIDIDKVDYLARDSLHAGVPYGRNFDQGRLIGGLCLNEAGDALAVTEKGKTAAEMMVFARYVMFSEVYWHHAVRAATAMLQRAFFLLHDQLDLDALFRLTEAPFIDELRRAAGDGPAAELLGGLFGPARRLYKRLAEYGFLTEAGLYEQLARRPYPWLAALAEQFAEELSRRLARRVAPHEVLLDAPPVSLEVQFDLDVNFPKSGRFLPLAEVSPVVQALASRQFDHYVKRVRLFVHPALGEEVRRLEDVTEILAAALARME